jgi:nitrate reductase gamma subunit
MARFDNVQKNVVDEYKLDESNVEIKMDLWLQKVFVLQLQNLQVVKHVIRKHVLLKQTKSQQKHIVDIMARFDNAQKNVVDEHKPDESNVGMKTDLWLQRAFVLQSQNPLLLNLVIHKNVLM